MSETKKQVLIVSLYDRGFYLSNELAEQGHEVTLLNLPYKFEDTSFWSNPFGYFKKKRLTYNQKYYLGGESSQLTESGLSVWLNDGPVNFKDKFSKSILRSRGLLTDHQPKKTESNDWLSCFSKSIFFNY